MFMGIVLNDLQIRKMVCYVVSYFRQNCPENLDAMVHLIGHDEKYRKRVEEITEAILSNHDELFVTGNNGISLEEVTPKYAENLNQIRLKMENLVNDYLSETSEQK